MIQTEPPEVKILFLDHFNRHGGAQEYILDIAKHIRQTGSTVFIPEIRNNSVKKYAQNIPTTNFDILSDSMFNPKIPFILIKNIIQIRAFIKKNRINVVHCNSLPPLIILPFLGSKVKKVLTVHDLNLPTFKVFLIKKLVKNIIAVSNSVKKDLESSDISNNIKTIYNGFPDLAKGNSAPSHEGITFGFAGRLEKWKGVDLFIRAAKKLLEKYGNINFKIFGYTEDKNYYNSLLQLINNSMNFEIIPFTQNKSQIFNSIDILVNCSTQPEPFGRTLIEAAIFNLPVIGPDHGGPVEIIEDGKSGLVFKNNNLMSLYTKMEELYLSNAKRKEMADNGRFQYEKKFNINIISRKVLSFYNSCI